jgi:hypothetical protein
VGEFHEDGMVFDVEVMEDTSDDEWVRLRVKVLKLIRESKMFYSPDVGEVFDVAARREGRQGGWSLFFADGESAP